MPTKANLLIIEGKRSGSVQYYTGLRLKGYNISLASTGAEIDAYLDRIFPDLIIFNSSSLRSNGRRILNMLSATYTEVPVILILNSESHPFNLSPSIKTLIQPFTAQKLVNTIKRCLHIESKKLLQAGPVRLDLVNNWVQIKDRKVQLTPQLVLLLSALMGKPGVTIPREELFRKVWETDYIEDMRTLDVHISWLRKAMEINPRKPNYIKTERSVGYRLEIPGVEQKPK